jgi:methyltransferase (TIGR00027 family)
MSPVANTARWTAAIRAYETERPDRLFDDPLARALAGEEGLHLLGPAGPKLEDVGAYVAIRTKFFDDFLTRASSEGLRQVVVLAAGMDTRPFRLSWTAGTTVFEIDTPELLAMKNKILTLEGARPRCRRVCVPVDLLTAWPAELRSQGFNALEPALWIAEGLFFYLDPPVVQTILRQLSELAKAGSRLGADFVSESFFTSPWMKNALASLEARGMGWHSGMDDPEAVLSGFGWEAEVRQPGEQGAGVGRWPYPVVPRNVAEVPHSLLVTATKRYQDYC